MDDIQISIKIIIFNLAAGNIKILKCLIPF